MIKNRQYSSSSIDIWQLKIMKALVKKQQASDCIVAENTSVLSMEILKSLLMKFRLLMDERLQEQKLLLKSFLEENKLSFLQEQCAASIQELVKLVVFYDMRLNFLSEPLNLENVNLLQFMFEVKKRQASQSSSSDFVANLWNVLKT
jgi:hypothetical protein